MSSRMNGPGSARGSLAVLSTILLLVATQVDAQSEGPRSALFEKVAGSWSGVGVAAVEGGSPERIRCRADYIPSSSSRLHLELRCASDAFNLQVESDIAREGDRIVGTWTETSAGISGDVSGTVGPDRLRATVAGLGVSAQLSMTLRGDVQGVTLVSRGQFAASATVTLRRA